MTLRKTTLAVGALLALGLGLGTADQAAAGSCGAKRMAGVHAGPYGYGPRYGYSPGWMAAPTRPYRYNQAPTGPHAAGPMGPRPTMLWAGPTPQSVKTVKTSSQPGDIVDVALATGSFNMLTAALQAAELVDTLKGDGPFTVFAPTDDAFLALPKDQLKALLGDREALAEVLTYHVVPGRVLAADVAVLESAKTVQGSSVAIDTADGVKVNGANVVKTDVLASNGVIHVIDAVILPE
jgi:uncharacterized surface protein with fasciclin (FAS1) repeats